MAKLGDRLYNPEDGWRRYEEDNPNFTYINGSYSKWKLYEYGTNNTYYSKNKCMMNDVDVSKNSYLMKIKFNVITNKIRLIAFSRYYNSNNIQIKIDDDVYKYSIRDFDLATATIVFEKLDLMYKEHTVEITNLLDSATDNYLYFDAVDIDENGELKTYNEYPHRFIIKQNSQYYTIKGNELTLLENQILDKNNFETNGFKEIGLLTQENTFYEETRQVQNNVFEYNLNKEIKKIEMI